MINTKQNVNTELYDKYKDLWAHCYYIDNQIYFDGQNSTSQNVDSVKKSEFQDIITRLNSDFISYPPTTLPTTKSTENNGETPKGGVTTVQCGYNQLIIMISNQDLNTFASMSALTLFLSAGLSGSIGGPWGSCVSMLIAVGTITSVSFGSLAANHPNGVVLVYEPYYGGMRLVGVFSQYIHTEK